MKKNENPLVNTGILGKIKSGKKNTNLNNTGNIKSVFVGMNDGIRICAEASACCWDKPVPEAYDDKAEYVGKRVRVNHTSVLEHSNRIIYMAVDKAYADDIIEFLDICNYLHTWAHKSKDGSKWHILLGGSSRAYADLYLSTGDLNNPLLKAVTKNLHTYTNSAEFEDICKFGLLNKDGFMNLDPTDSMELISDRMVTSNDLFDIISCDSLAKLESNLNNIDPEITSLMDVYDLLPFLTVTVLFKDMSRIITQQLTRHRNGITQESQRYVDYSKSQFKSPAEFVPKYDPDHKYSIRFASSGVMKLNLQEIGDAICSIYGQLNNPVITGANNVLKREDARGYLPSNTKCRKIYITFTYKYLLKFLHLREDKAAQAEIRHYAMNLGGWFRDNTLFDTKELCDNYVLPKLLHEKAIKFAAHDVDVAEEVVEITEDDYIKAAGLDVEEDTVNTNE